MLILLLSRKELAKGVPGTSSDEAYALAFTCGVSWRHLEIGDTYGHNMKPCQDIVYFILSSIFSQIEKGALFNSSDVVSQIMIAFGVTCCAAKRFVIQEVPKRSRSVTLAGHRDAAMYCGGGDIHFFMVCGLDSCNVLRSGLLTIALLHLTHEYFTVCFEVHIITVWLS